MDPRGSADDVTAAARGIAHDDSAKQRTDESSVSRSHSSPPVSGTRAASRLPRFAVPVGAAVLLLVVVGGAIAVTSGDDETNTSGSGSGSGQGPGSGSGGDAAAGQADAFSGTTQFNFDGPNGVGTTTVSLTCGASCTVAVDAVTGHNDNVRTWIPAALGHTYDGSGDTYSFVGSAITSCDQVERDEFWSDPSLWSADLTVTAGQITIVAALDAFDGDTCGVSGTEVTFTGTPVS